MVKSIDFSMAFTIMRAGHAQASRRAVPACLVPPLWLWESMYLLCFYACACSNSKALHKLMPVVPQILIRHSSYITKLQLSPPNHYSNLSFIVNVVLHRHPEYYVWTCRKWSIQILSIYHIYIVHNFCCKSKIFNLLVPMLLVTLTGIASVFIPFQSESRLNMALTILLTYIFLQTLVASMSPKSASSPIVRDMHRRRVHMAHLGTCPGEIFISCWFFQ